MKCDICKRDGLSADELTSIPDTTEGLMVLDEVRVCASCLVDGIAEGHVNVNPDALEPEDNEDEGEEWKS